MMKTLWIILITVFVTLFLVALVAFLIEREEKGSRACLNGFYDSYYKANEGWTFYCKTKEGVRIK